ncbi:Glycosyl hydrolase-like 10 [Chitinophaga costaii]|uniref:Glycosyl hydrolase-like 10 n=1 Tax=Chitinophaga costaii TaxID=1335309 RepID=A0A1C4AWU1_9BACT|nr:family 10 glycosylhydrolase [Chitinophaga costaii]PUZ26777.1 Tat pathway signal protein [Chitinophaga costaii]SCB99021.1 Glycosyl hydrolase-like 10 [Chitinophaga costaii]
MNKRHFLKSVGLGSLALLHAQLPALGRNPQPTPAPPPGGKPQHRIWINPNPQDSDADLALHYTAYAQAGIADIYFEADSERHFRAAKIQGIRAHRWIWTMNRGEKELLAAHPEWYAQNRQGESCATHPPYVDYYRWLCPNKPEVLEYLKTVVHTELSKDYVDGIHLDYVRYCDVILPVHLWAHYGIDQSKELPAYDFCYCNTCRDDYKALKGKDPLEMEHPDQSPSWRKYRYDRITNVVTQLADVAHKHKKPISAAVFPTPEIAKRIVRQDWTNWPLNAVSPMIYHGFYDEDVAWIGDAVAEGVKALHGKFPLYAGLYLPDFHGNMNDLGKGIQLAMDNGAAGVSFFGEVTPDVLKTLIAAG